MVGTFFHVAGYRITREINFRAIVSDFKIISIVPRVSSEDT